MKILGRWQYGLVVAFVVLMSTSLATAQDAEQTGMPEAEQTQQPLELEELRVVGSRSLGRTAADSPVPVDVIDGENFKNYGVRDLNNLLAATIPSYNVTQHAIGDANALVRPAKMRGLPPDSTLVLVNGNAPPPLVRYQHLHLWAGPRGARRRHSLDPVHCPQTSGSACATARGAQYGSDAVAGVLNFVLRDAPEGGTVEARWGQYYQGDGDQVSTAANIGLPLTDAGFANLSFEFTNADSTNRSVQRTDALAAIASGNEHVRRGAVQVWGAPDVPYDYKFFGNFGLDLGDHHHAYAFGNWAEREIYDSWYWRSPYARPGVFTDPSGPGGGWSMDDPLLIADLSPDGRSGGCPTKHHRARLF